jgi:hypothetical protein
MSTTHFKFSYPPNYSFDVDSYASNSLSFANLNFCLFLFCAVVDILKTSIRKYGATFWQYIYIITFGYRDSCFFYFYFPKFINIYIFKINGIIHQEIAFYFLFTIVMKQECDFNTHKFDFYTQSTISKCKVHESNSDTYAWEYDTHECDL